MSPPDLYRSEAFAEDLPDCGYEPLPLRPAQPQHASVQSVRSVIGAVRAAFGVRSLRPIRREGGGSVQLA